MAFRPRKMLEERPGRELGMPAYTIQKTTVAPEFTGAWDGPVWSRAETLTVNLFHPASSGHRPGVQARALYEAKGIYVIFKVKDRYVRSVNTQPQGPVAWNSSLSQSPAPDT